MRCNPWRWLWGVIPIAMLTWLACTWEREGIETDLRSRAEAALETQGFGWGQVALDGRDALLTGVAPDDAQPYRATETVRNVKGVRIVRARTDAAPGQVTAETKETELSWRGDGHAAPEPREPSAEAKDSELTWKGDGHAAPEPREHAAEAKDSELPWKGDGHAAPEPDRPAAEAKDSKLAWRGDGHAAPEPQAPDAVGMTALSDAERAEWEAKWADAKENERRWKEEGDRDHGKAVEDAARQRAEAEEAARLKAEDEAKSKAEADERQRAEAAAAEDAKRREDEAARAAEAEKQRLAEEEAREQAASEAEAQRLADEKAKAEEEAEAKRKADEEAAEAKRKADAEAADAEAKAKREQELAAARQKDTEEVKRKAEADHCQGLMRSAMAEGIINFAKAKADLTRDSFLTLDRLAGIVKVCPKAHINIAGHTDSEGETERNQALSERRAKIVGDYLIGKGVDSTRLTSEGFGETRPLAPNDTPDGMRQNRRIEFNVTPAP